MIDQYPTPAWLAEAIIERYFSDLTASDLVYEPSCHSGMFLRAIPEHVPAIGIEIDPVPAEEARRTTGRRVIVGDFLTVPIDDRPTAVIGNPPFSMMVQFLDRAYRILEQDGRVGFIMPAYAFQTSNTVVRYSERWSLQVEMIPRDAFSKEMEKHLSFAIFTKDQQRRMIGLAFYQQAADVRRTHKAFRDLLRCGRPYRSAWRAVVEAALEYMGGEATLQELYTMIEPERPTGNQFWKDKVRQIVQTHCVHKGHARWGLPTTEAA